MSGSQAALLPFAAVSVLLTVIAVTASPVTFPSGEDYTPLDNQSPPGHEDPEDTGSLAFERRPENSRLAWGLTLDEWSGGPNRRIFRAHPDLIGCLADMNSDLQADGDRLRLVRGYLPLSETGPSPAFPINYHAAGSAAEVALRTAVTSAASSANSVQQQQRRLVAAFARACATRLTAAGWDFGLVAKQSPQSTATLTVLLQSRRKPSKLVFQADGGDFVDSAQLEAWTRRHWELGFFAGFNASAELETACSGASGYLHGPAVKPEAIVGPGDELAVPPESEDYARLMQYPASSRVEGDVSAGAFVFPDCPKYLSGWERHLKCSARLMSSRMYQAVRKLDALMRLSWPNLRLKVTAGWVAPTADRPSLRSEGRLLDLELLNSDGSAVVDPEALPRVANLASCSGFDFASNIPADSTSSFANQRLRLAVLKQRRPPAESPLEPVQAVVFHKTIGSGLLPVEPPQRLVAQYDVTGMEPLALADKPLFDGYLDPETPLGSYSRLGMFKSPSAEFRYFRLHPALVACYDAIMESAVNKLTYSRGRADSVVPVVVRRAYLTEFDERALLEPASDPRVGGHPEGVAMQLAFDTSSPAYLPGPHTVWRLAEAAATVCAPKFHEHRGMFGVGVYNDSVYIDMRPVAKVWLECDPRTSHFTTCPLTPPPSSTTVGNSRSFGSASEDFKVFLLEKALQAIHGRVVEPLAGEANCEFDRPPQDQSPDFVYRPPRIRPPPEGDKAFIAPVSNCQSGSSSEFCAKAAATLATEVGHLWSDISTKHLLAGADRVRQAMENCLLTCSSVGCASLPEGPWQKKLEACESLAHWLPFDLENNLPSRISNFYTPGDRELRKLACYSGEHCVDWSPLHSLLGPVLSAWFRPKPTGVAKENLLDAEGNPSPLPAIVRRLYAHYAFGDVKVWLRDETDVKSVLEELKVIFLYNKNVTSVTVMVLDSRSVNQVASQLETEFGDWLHQACPSNSRPYLTPHRVVSFNRQEAFAVAAMRASEESAVEQAMHPSVDAIDLKNW